MEEWVLVDTCIWASFFSKPSSPEKAAVDKLLDADRVALAGPLVAEVLLGFRRKDQADWVASRLRSAHYLEAGWDDWRAAADLGRDMAALGHKLPLTDLVTAAVARRCQTWVYSNDPHFDLIPGLKQYRPGT
jgi:predicted nucleic acid-binding protein